MRLQHFVSGTAATREVPNAIQQSPFPTVAPGLASLGSDLIQLAEKEQRILQNAEINQAKNIVDVGLKQADLAFDSGELDIPGLTEEYKAVFSNANKAIKSRGAQNVIGPRLEASQKLAELRIKGLMRLEVVNFADNQHQERLQILEDQYITAGTQEERRAIQAQMEAADQKMVDDSVYSEKDQTKRIDEWKDHATVAAVERAILDDPHEAYRAIKKDEYDLDEELKTKLLVSAKKYINTQEREQAMLLGEMIEQNPFGEYNIDNNRSINETQKLSLKNYQKRAQDAQQEIMRIKADRDERKVIMQQQREISNDSREFYNKVESGNLTPLDVQNHISKMNRAWEQGTITDAGAQREIESAKQTLLGIHVNKMIGLIGSDGDLSLAKDYFKNNVSTDETLGPDEKQDAQDAFAKMESMTGTGQDLNLRRRLAIATILAKTQGLPDVQSIVPEIIDRLQNSTNPASIMSAFNGLVTVMGEEDLAYQKYYGQTYKVDPKGAGDDNKARKKASDLELDYIIKERMKDKGEIQNEDYIKETARMIVDHAFEKNYVAEPTRALIRAGNGMDDPETTRQVLELLFDARTNRPTVAAQIPDVDYNNLLPLLIKMQQGKIDLKTTNGPQLKGLMDASLEQSQAIDIPGRTNQWQLTERDRITSLGRKSDIDNESDSSFGWLLNKARTLYLYGGITSMDDAEDEAVRQFNVAYGKSTVGDKRKMLFPPTYFNPEYDQATGNKELRGYLDNIRSYDDTNPYKGKRFIIESGPQTEATSFYTVFVDTDGDGSYETAAMTDMMQMVHWTPFDLGGTPSMIDELDRSILDKVQEKIKEVRKQKAARQERDKSESLFGVFPG